VASAVVVRLQAGDADAIRDLYETFGRSVWAVAFRIVGRRDLADDVAQRTFVQAWEHAHTLDPERDPGPWLHTVARRAAIGLLRKERPDRTLSLADDGVSRLPAGDSDLEVRTWETFEVRRALDKLPQDERNVVRLTHLLGYAQAEVAERLGIPLGTVKSRMGRAFKRLAAELAHVRDEVTT
jgi:RNA polymerase sigma-70 factor (ECF subfamily)